MSTDKSLMNLARRDWLTDGPLDSIVTPYIEALRKQRYADHTIRSYLGCLAHFNFWIKSKDVDLMNVNSSLVKRFLLNHLPACTCPSPCYSGISSSGAALRHLLRLLPCEWSVASTDPVGVELERFTDYLANICGVAPVTRDGCIQHVRSFLVHMFGTETPIVSQLSVTQLDVFFAERSAHLRPSSLRTVCNSLRSYFRYRALLGESTDRLVAALPRIADWRRATLPKVLSDSELVAFLNAFDRTNPVGQRDYAMARCLLDLGLRGHEVTYLTLESFDWRNATLTISSAKSKHVQQLPLPVSTGEAVARYLWQGRPKTTSRMLFVRHRAPFDKPLGIPAIRNSMNRAFVRCGLYDRFCNTHVLRRTMATRLQQAGASVKEIADLLRHQSLDTASVYARVDLEGLRAVAMAWEPAMNHPVSWMSRVETYLAYRRCHGFMLTIDATQLRSFARFADETGTADHLTVALAIAWARASQRPSPITWARRIEVLQGFAHFCLREDPLTEILPRHLFGPAHRRLTPHIYTEAEVSTLLEAAKSLAPTTGLRPVTCRCVFGLLAATGLRIAEALALTTTDVDLDTGVLLIREAKFHQQRLVPMHSSVTNSLSKYAQERNKLIPRPICDRFFLRDDGSAANQSGILYALQTLCQQLGWQPRSDYPHHRLHDLRHTFIVRNLLRFYEQDIDVDRAILALSTYVGHVNVSNTYWYTTGIPELMSIAAERFYRYSQGAIR